MSETDIPQFDLSLEAEANEIETITVEVKQGVVIEFPVIDEWPIEANELLQAGQLGKVLDILFEDQPEDRDALRRLRVKDIRKILEHLAAKAGVAPGEGSGSAS